MSQTRVDYDQIPYVKYAHEHTHPSKLRVIGRLFGMQPAAPENCRVLELGSASGTNLIQMGYFLPESEFVGVELSQNQAEQAHRQVQQLHLTNVQAKHFDIMEVNDSFGKFDYIIVHGIFSWVSRPVQDKILEICRRNLTEQGIAYVSYNAYPGWFSQQSIRELMLFHAAKFEDSKQKLKESLALVKLCDSVAAQRTDHFSQFLHQQFQSVLNKPPEYVNHEFLEDTNEPVYFHDFISRATTNGLQYLGESELAAMACANLPPGWEHVPRETREQQVAVEQYVDFLRNRQFRRTLLCQSEIRLPPVPDSSVLTEMSFNGHIRSEAVDDGQVCFHVGEKTMTTSDAGNIAVMEALAAAWPGDLDFDALKDVSQPALTHAGDAETHLLTLLLECASHQMVTTAHPYLNSSDWHLAPTDRVNPLVRTQLQAQQAVFDRRSRPVPLSNLEREVATRLDGRRHATIVNELVGKAKRGEIVLKENGAPLVGTHYRCKEILADAVKSTVSRFAKLQLLQASG